MASLAVIFGVDFTGTHILVVNFSVSYAFCPFSRIKLEHTTVGVRSRTPRAEALLPQALDRVAESALSRTNFSTTAVDPS